MSATYEQRFYNENRLLRLTITAIDCSESTRQVRMNELYMKSVVNVVDVSLTAVSSLISYSYISCENALKTGYNFSINVSDFSPEQLSLFTL